ncbi:MAG: RagB/SusD family nutrient uptake outer membrane protein, partial [Bacteroidales bacterium]|nr:RagB/SusD family nutrient uptake outer membrane protein [Bacteroidales bacterium]
MKTKIIFSLLIVLFTMSCSEDILDVPNENAYNGDTFFTTPAAYEEAATAMYTPLLHEGMYARDFYFIFDLLGNDAGKNFPLQGSLLDFPLYTHSPNNGEVTKLFNACYKITFRTNFVIDLMEKWETIIDTEIAQKQRIHGEALFLKSFANFLLVNLWGDVPLKRTLEDHEVLHDERTPKAEIWAAIEADLKEAINKLPVSYDADGYGRATQGAAIALLGKTYLFQKKYAEAATEFGKITGGSFGYGLADSLDDLFVNDVKTNETIFAIMHGEWQGWGVGNAYYMFGGQEKWGGKASHTGRAMEFGFNDWNNVVVSDVLANSYTYQDESGADYTDPRAALTFYSKDGIMGGDSDYVAGAYELDGIAWRKYERYEYQEKEFQPESPINSHV